MFIIPFFLIVLIFIQGFFTSTEMAVVSSNKIKIRYLADQKNKRAMIINKLLNSPEQLFGITLFSINIITVILSMLTDFYFESIIEKHITFVTNYIPVQLLVVLIIEPIILIFGELTPMSIGRKYPTTISLKNAYIFKALHLFLTPFITPIIYISRLFQKISGSKKNNSFSRDELEIVMTTAHIPEENAEMSNYIKEVLNISKLTASDVMIHINEVTLIEESATIKEVKELIKKTKKSRIPIYKENILNITGTVHVLNILDAPDDEIAANYSDKLYIVPSTKPILQLLKELKKNRKYIGIIVDDYGAACGIISLEDIIKRIISEVKQSKIEKAQNKNLEFDGLMKLEDFYQETGIDIREDGVSTLNGLINYTLGRIARKGETVTYKDYKFEILDATDRIIKKIRLINKNN